MEKEIRSESKHPQVFDLKSLKKERISTQCVCCGSHNLKSSPAVLMPFVSHRAFGWSPVVIDESWGLKTIKSGNAYSICKTLMCVNCDFLFLDIRFSDTELSNLYRDYRGKEYSELREHYEPGYALRNEVLDAGVPFIDKVEAFLEPHLTFPITMLDWGGDTGKNSPFKNRNVQFDIYDISSKAVIDGARVVSRQEAFSRKYQLIVSSNVLEHVPYPSDLIVDMKNTMDKDSILYIEVPFEEVVRTNPADYHLKKKHWHEHINFFSEKSLVSLVQSSGLQVIALNKLDISSGGTSAFQFQLACKLK